ncbi:MAG TPA: response regulator [Verrucomicrobiae bacterium]|jgi:HD-like signal output (HDOD) protein|nr:response regulator [Verrucomicrobiae bacterium]
MKKRILFVDDEEMVLRGLGRLLRPMSHEWEMQFVTSGAKALEKMAEVPFDIVVSDMRMPGMNGAELLNEVMKRYPRTVRLILSGFADRELILKCVGSTHQYLSKPCDERELKMAMLRATRLEESLENETLRQLVTRCSTLPSVPALYSEIIEVLQDPEANTDAIGDIIAKDGGMTARILKLANSAFFGLGREISNISEGVTYLGTETIKSLILFSNAFAQPETSKLLDFAAESLWRHSLEAANAAKAIAAGEGSERKVVDEAYVSGLLHDVGKLVLASNLPEQYHDVVTLARSEKIPLCAAERKVFNADHADVGGYLLGLWGLPVPVVEAIAFHHRPAAAVEKRFSPLTALHAGNILASSEHPVIADIPPSDLDQSYLDALGLGNRMETWRNEWKNLLS